MPSALKSTLQKQVRVWPPWLTLKLEAFESSAILEHNNRERPICSFSISREFQTLDCLPEPNASFSWTPEFSQAESFSKMLVGFLSVRLLS